MIIQTETTTFKSYTHLITVMDCDTETIDFELNLIPYRITEPLREGYIELDRKHGALGKYTTDFNQMTEQERYNYCVENIMKAERVIE